jgi:hypothetical protein
MKYWVMYFLVLFDNLCTAQTRRSDYGLNMILEKGVTFSEESKSLNIIFYNNSSDTLYLPVDYFYLTNCIEINFIDSITNRPICGKVQKKCDTDTTALYCNDFRLFEILPFQFRVYNYSLNLCSSFEKNISYNYQIKMNIHFETTVVCSKVWQGEIYSNIGSFKIENTGDLDWDNSHR